jgi:hypothetical protein
LHATKFEKMQISLSSSKEDTRDPHAVAKYTNNRRPEERTQTPGSSLIDDDLAYLVAQPAWKARSIPYRPLNQATSTQPAHQSQGTDWNGLESDLTLVPFPTFPTFTQVEAIDHWPELESPPNTPNIAGDCTPASTSTHSAIESEGERSFIDAMDYVGQISAESGDHALAPALAQMSLQRCIQGSYRALQKTNTGSPSDSTSQNRQQNSKSSSSSLPGSRSSIKRPFNSDKHPGDRDEAEDNKDSKKTRRSALGQSAHSRQLACPYYRFDVGRYSECNRDEVCYRGCSSVCLRDISRLKQHLY